MSNSQANFRIVAAIQCDLGPKQSMSSPGIDESPARIGNSEKNEEHL